MKRYGLIGYPLGHSFSKKYFTKKFEKEGLADVSFELYPIEQIEQFPKLISEIPNLRGLAVTIPYKSAVIPYLQHISEESAQIGAVNCIKVSSGMLTGYNTDAIGFEQSILPLLKPFHKQAIILGTGGASKAVQYILHKLSIPFMLVSRNYSDLHHSYKDLNAETMDAYQVIINCTPLGMAPNSESFPDIPYNFITKQHLLYDLVYEPAQTQFLKLGALQGAQTKNGFEMLILQAEENWHIWNQ